MPIGGKGGGLAALILSSKKPSKPEPELDEGLLGEEDEGLGDDQAAQETAMSAFMESLQGDNASEALEAFKSLMEVCH
jgi:hypothetical protein